MICVLRKKAIPIRDSRTQSMAFNAANLCPEGVDRLYAGSDAAIHCSTLESVRYATIYGPAHVEYLSSGQIPTW